MIVAVLSNGGRYSDRPYLLVEASGSGNEFGVTIEPGARVRFAASKPAQYDHCLSRRKEVAVLDQFTEEARKAVVRAQEEARRLDHSHIGTEHLLLGLLRDGESTAATALAGSGLSLDVIRQRVEQIIGRGADKPGAHLAFTVPAKQAIQTAMAEAHRRTQQVGPQHLLFGILDQHEDTSVRVLAALGTDIGQARQRLVESME